MKIVTELTIEKNANVVWQVMGNQFDQIHIWASFFKDSKPSGEKKFNEIAFSARETIVEGGENTHSLDVFDAKNHTLSYTVTGGAPPFAVKAQAEWALEITNGDSCTASITVNMELKDMIPEEKAAEIQLWLSKSSGEMLEELKHYVETGNLHSRKTNAQ
ncbi:MAG: hypothetical protein ACI9J3_002796 [Parvicellaceae bacterium]|jgi:hypothetical protein